MVGRTSSFIGVQGKISSPASGENALAQPWTYYKKFSRCCSLHHLVMPECSKYVILCVKVPFFRVFYFYVSLCKLSRFKKIVFNLCEGISNHNFKEKKRRREAETFAYFCITSCKNEFIALKHFYA